MPRDAKKAPTARELVAARQAAATKTADVVTVDNREHYERLLDEMAPSSTPGRPIKFSHDDGVFQTRDDGQEVSQKLEFAALCGETMVGYMKFNGKGEQPDARMGRLYDNFVVPPRESLGDTDQTRWEIDPWGQPDDPWKINLWLVLQRIDTGELCTFIAANPTTLVGRYIIC